MKLQHKRLVPHMAQVGGPEYAAKALNPGIVRNDAIPQPIAFAALQDGALRTRSVHAL